MIKAKNTYWIADCMTAESIITKEVVTTIIGNELNYLGEYPTTLVSIWGTDYIPAWPFLHPRAFVGKFDDCTYAVQGYVQPTRAQVAALLNAGNNLPEGDVLVHCAAGISRSSAIVAGLLAMANRKDVLPRLVEVGQKSASQCLKSPGIHPNACIIHYVDELLGFNGDLFDTFEAAWPRAYRDFREHTGKA